MFENEIILLLLSLLAFGGGLVIVERFELPSFKRFSLYVDYLAGISVLLVIYNLYVSSQHNQQIEKNRIAYDTIQNIQNNYLGPQKELIATFPEGYFLYASMNQDSDLQKHLPQSYDEVKRRQIELYSALRIFQSIEDFLSTARFDLSGISAWVNVFLMWMQSPILQEHWHVVKFNFAQDTQEFVDAIIVKANNLAALRKQNGKLTPNDYDAISKSFAVKIR